MMRKRRILLILLSSMVISGCMTLGSLDGSGEMNHPDDPPAAIRAASRRCFPANWDDRQYCVFGTNGWSCVDYYPDGLPMRISEGDGVDGSEHCLTKGVREFDFLGRELPAKDSQSDIVGSCSYETVPRRVCRGASILSKDYSLDVYYYVEGDETIVVGIWAIDRNRGVMDKRIAKVDAAWKGKPRVNETCHTGNLVGIAEINRSQDMGIDLDLDIHLSSRTMRKSIHIALDCHNVAL